MSTFLDKPNFNLKQVITAVTIAFTIGGGVYRYESRSNIMEHKLDNLTVLITGKVEEYNNKFTLLSQRVDGTDVQLRSINTSLNAIKPEEISLKRRR